MNTDGYHHGDMASLSSTAPFEPQALRVVTDADEGTESIQILSLWPPRAAESPCGLVWTPWVPVLHHDFVDHPLPDCEEARYAGDFWGWGTALEVLFEAIPAATRRNLHDVPYHDYWTSLRLLYLLPEARAVFATTPVLGTALARQVAAAEDEEAATERVRAGLERPPHLLLGLIDLPAEPWAHEVVGRLGSHSLQLVGLDGIRAALTSGRPRVRRLLRELPRIREDVLSLLLEGPLELATDALLADPDGCIVAALDVYLDAIAVGRRDGLVPRMPVRFSSRAQVLEAYRALLRVQGEARVHRPGP